MAWIGIDAAPSRPATVAADIPAGEVAVTLELTEVLRPVDLGRNTDARKLGSAPA